MEARDGRRKNACVAAPLENFAGPIVSEKLMRRVKLYKPPDELVHGGGARGPHRRPSGRPLSDGIGRGRLADDEGLPGPAGPAASVPLPDAGGLSPGAPGRTPPNGRRRSVPFRCERNSRTPSGITWRPVFEKWMVFNNMEPRHRNVYARIFSTSPGDRPLRCEDAGGVCGVVCAV